MRVAPRQQVMSFAPKMLHSFQIQSKEFFPQKRIKRNTNNLCAKLKIQPNQYAAIILIRRIITATVFRMDEYQPIWSDLLPLHTNADCPSKL